MNEAELIFFSVKIWAYIGGVVAFFFLIFGIDRIDEDARGAYIFRPLLIPGVVLIWPLVLWRWFALERGTEDWRKRYKPVRKVHGTAALLMAIVVAATIAIGLGQRQTWPTDYEPQLISGDVEQSQ
ncbi:MAG: hypothetical protein AAGF28_00680 [Pseudomonadota bacterium]